MQTRNFRKFQKLLVILAFLAVTQTSAAKKKMNTYFPRGTGIIVNAPLASFDEDIK